MTLDHSLEIAAIAALLLFAGFLVTAGTAIGAASRGRMTELERRGIEKAAAVRQLIALPDRVSAAIAVGATAALVFATAIATRLALSLYGPPGPAYAAALIAVLALIFVQALPKAVALVAPDRVALATAVPFTRVTNVLAPLAGAIEAALTRGLALVGISPTARTSRSVDDELRGTIDLHQRSGTAGKIDLDMLGGVLDLKELELFDVMVHRTKMRSLDAGSPPAQILEEILKRVTAGSRCGASGPTILSACSMPRISSPPAGRRMAMSRAIDIEEIAPRPGSSPTPPPSPTSSPPFCAARFISPWWSTNMARSWVS